LILDEFDFFINPQISKKRKIELVDFDYNLGIYSFFSIIYFMVIEEKELKHFKRKIDYLKMRILLNSDYRIFKFLELNLKNSQNQKNLKAQKLFNEFKKKINNSPFNKTPKNKFNIQIGFDSIHGIHKKGNINQDSYYHIKISDDKLLFMVADGVSTADIGSGDIISKRIQEYLSKNEEEIKNDINEILNKNIELSNCFKEYINKLIKNINASLEAIINDYLSEKNKNDEHVMSSTIIIGFIYDNLMITAHLGDSELLFIRDSEVTQLLTPHIGAIKEFRNISIQIDKGIFQGFVDVNKIVSLKEITNALPVGDIKNGKFFVDNNLHIENNIFYLKEKDIILVTTDGLSDSIENSGKELENYLNDFFKNEKTINRKVIRNLLNSVDSDGGIDDITVIGLLINSQKNSRLK
jgi:serine/threonine protein phosphatase PrpC